LVDTLKLRVWKSTVPIAANFLIFHSLCNILSFASIAKYSEHCLPTLVSMLGRTRDSHNRPMPFQTLDIKQYIERLLRTRLPVTNIAEQHNILVYDGFNRNSDISTITIIIFIIIIVVERNTRITMNHSSGRRTTRLFFWTPRREWH